MLVVTRGLPLRRTGFTGPLGSEIVDAIRYFLTPIRWITSHNQLSLFQVGVSQSQLEAAPFLHTRASGVAREGNSAGSPVRGASAQTGESTQSTSGQSDSQAAPPITGMRARWRRDAVAVGLLSGVGAVAGLGFGLIGSMSGTVGAVVVGLTVCTGGLAWFGSRRCRDIGDMLLSDTPVSSVPSESSRVIESPGSSYSGLPSASLRDRLHQQLHDDAGQQLTGASLLLVSLSQRLDRYDDPHSQDLVSNLTECVGNALNSVRSAALALTDESAYRGACAVMMPARSGGVAAALTGVAQAATRALGSDRSVRVEVDQEAAKRFARLGESLAAIAREGITNAARHGNADRVVVRLASEGGQGVLEVLDNGSGPSAESLRAPDGASGLRCIAGRAASFLGEVSLESWEGTCHGLAGGGARLRVVWPHASETGRRDQGGLASADAGEPIGQEQA